MQKSENATTFLNSGYIPPDPLSQLTGQNVAEMGISGQSGGQMAPTSPAKMVRILRIWAPGEKHGLFNLVREVSEDEAADLIGKGLAELAPPPDDPGPYDDPNDRDIHPYDQTPPARPTATAEAATTPTPAPPYATPATPPRPDLLARISPEAAAILPPPDRYEIRERARQAARAAAVKAARAPEGPAPKWGVKAEPNPTLNPNRVRFYRERLNLSKTQAGERAWMGTGQTACNRWRQLEDLAYKENGKLRKVTPRIIRQIAKALAVQPGDLCGPFGEVERAKALGTAGGAGGVTPADMAAYDRGYLDGARATHDTYTRAYGTAWDAAQYKAVKAGGTDADVLAAYVEAHAAALRAVGDMRTALDGQQVR